MFHTNLFTKILVILINFKFLSRLDYSIVCEILFMFDVSVITLISQTVTNWRWLEMSSHTVLMRLCIFEHVHIT